MEKYLHIICLNVPYPVDYGGVFDLFNKLPALKQKGIKIYLHCLEYGRGEQDVLNQYCEAVYYYKRSGWLKSLSTGLPYIVASRKNNRLLKRLLQDDHPILMEGIHCTYLLNDARFSNRACFLRLHNVEHAYYRTLYQLTTSWRRKLYYLWESKLLLSYETSIAAKVPSLTVTQKDRDVYEALGCKRVEYLAVFIPGWNICIKEGFGTFCLYHGDLSVAENERAALWFIEEIFSHVDRPLVIAGKKPSMKLFSFAEKNNNICVVADPDEKDMQDMIEKAQVNLLPSYSNTGIKLKLINVVFNGRHCLVNGLTVKGTNLETACYIAFDTTSWITIVKELMHKPFTEGDVALRRDLLDKMFDNEKNAQRLIDLIWNSNESV